MPPSRAHPKALSPPKPQASSLKPRAQRMVVRSYTIVPSLATDDAAPAPHLSAIGPPCRVGEGGGLRHSWPPVN